ncbi:TetR/AcrR family transcriptional regulator [Streptomyces griseus]|uniref:TetR/AcrR family transcriptional regulator n=1 Tax=Streptomyces griseus TaxID=1911 RepID=UPI00084072FB|nr:TetR/AcrR family transcriptional regulator [Streptomyces griseus]
MTTDNAAAPRRRGAVRTEELLRVTFELAAEVRYSDLTIAAVARRAGVGKHTIYRRWSTKSELLLDALHRALGPALDYRDTGDVRADLREQFIRSSAALLSPAIWPVYRAVIIAAQDDDALRERLYRQFLAVIEQHTLDRLTSAQRAGELVADADLGYPAEVLCGALYYRGLLSTRPIDEAAIDGLLDMFMAAYAASP